MHIVLTGATSFTGMWFARALAARGHQVSAIMRGPDASYRDLKRARLDQLSGSVRAQFGVAFGTPEFLAAIAALPPVDVLCHHAADATDYKSPDFDVVAALGANAHRLRPTLSALKDAGCARIVLTGSVFEADEGAGDAPLRAFNAYGMSKTLTSALFRFGADEAAMGLTKFTIPNPFGPFEEPRFTEYLLKRWAAGEVASVNTPAYVRDNIHVSLLAAAYVACVEAAAATGFRRVNPSGYVETQGVFATRFAREIGQRLQVEARLDLATQHAFPEPAVRINTDRCDAAALGWDEAEAWDAAAAYYADRFALAPRRG